MFRPALALALAACSARPPSAPPLTTGWVDVDATGLHAELTDARGTHRIVNFWATWCGPCLHELPLLTAYDDAHSGVDVSFVSIDHPSVRRRGESALQEHGLSGRRVLHLGEPDPTATLLETVAGWNNSIPVTIVISPTGQTLATYTYAVNEDILDTVLTGALQ